MTGRADMVERLAAATGEAWWTLCGAPKPWAATPEHERVTFRLMARAGLAAARDARRAGSAGAPGAVETAVARAMNLAFVTNPEAPWWLRESYGWARCLPAFRQVFLIVARAFLAEGARIRAEVVGAREPGRLAEPQMQERAREVA